MSIQFREELNGKGTVQDVVDLLVPIAPQARITGGIALRAAAGAGLDQFQRALNGALQKAGIQQAADMAGAAGRGVVEDKAGGSVSVFPDALEAPGNIALLQVQGIRHATQNRIQDRPCGVLLQVIHLIREDQQEDIRLKAVSQGVLIEEGGGASVPGGSQIFHIVEPGKAGQHRIGAQFTDMETEFVEHSHFILGREERLYAAASLSSGRG